MSDTKIKKDSRFYVDDGGRLLICITINKRDYRISVHPNDLDADFQKELVARFQQCLIHAYSKGVEDGKEELGTIIRRTIGIKE